jgi:WD40 repeat protein
VEAVIKSLDPTQKQMRAQTQTGATVILHELVKTYPSITFHGRSQKLAIGTPEGAIVIYDLKTGTKMDILESFRTPVVAASFSIDGQRLVAVSLDENRIEIWKFAGSPFAIGSFFNFASSSSASNAAPFASRMPSSSGSANLELGKHHHGSSKPFKSLSFNVGEEGLHLSSFSLYILNQKPT